MVEPQRIEYVDFSGGINEAVEEEKLSRGELAAGFDVDLIRGSIRRRQGWKPLHQQLYPFYPSTKHAYIIMPALLGEDIDSDQWTIQFAMKIERKRDDGEQYAILSKEGITPVLGGSPDYKHVLQLYWVDAETTSNGGFWLRYSSSTFMGNTTGSNAEFDQQVADPSELPAVGETVMVTIRKVDKGATWDLDIFLGDVLTGTISDVGGDDFATLIDTIAPWYFGWSELEAGTVVTHFAPITVGEFRFWNEARNGPAEITPWLAHELPLSERGSTLKYYIPMSSPPSTFLPATVGSYDAYIGYGRPLLRGGGFFDAGFLFNGSGSTLRLVADTDWANQINYLEAPSSTDKSWFFSVSGVAYGNQVLIFLPTKSVTSGKELLFEISLYGTDGAAVNPRLRWRDDSDVIQSDVPSLSVALGEPYTLTVSYDESTNLVFYALTQGSTTQTDVSATVVNVSDAGNDVEVDEYFRIGSATIANNAVSFLAHIGVVDRVLIRLGDNLSGYPNDEMDSVLLTPDSPWWSEMDVVIQPPNTWKSLYQVPPSLDVQRGRHPRASKGHTEVFLDASWVPTSLLAPSNTTPPWQVTTQTLQIIPAEPIKILWAGSFELRSSTDDLEPTLVVVPGGIYRINSDGSVEVAGTDMPLVASELPDAFLASGFLVIQGHRDSRTYLFDGLQAFQAVPDARPRTVTGTLSGGGSLSGDYAWELAYFVGGTGGESRHYRTLRNGTSSQAFTLAWVPSEAPQDVTTMRIYRTASDDQDGSLFLIDEVPIEDGTYTDAGTAIAASDVRYDYDQISIGGMCAGYYQQRLWWADPFSPELIYFSPAGRWDRIEDQRIAEGPVRKFFGLEGAFLAASDVGLFIVQGEDGLNYGLIPRHRRLIPGSRRGGTPIIDHPQGFAIYWTKKGLLADNLETRELISRGLETTIATFDFEKMHLLSAADDTQEVRSYLSAIVSGSSAPDRLMVWSTSRTTGKTFWMLYRLPIDYIGDVVLGGIAKTVFAIAGYLCELAQAFDGWDGGSSANDNMIEVDGSASSTTKLVVTSSTGVLTDGDLNGRTLYRSDTGESVRVAFSIGQAIYLQSALSSAPDTSSDEEFLIGRIQGTFRLKKEIVMTGPRYTRAVQAQVRGSGGDLSLSVEVDAATATATLDLDRDDRVSAFIGHSGRSMQVSGTMLEEVTVRTIELWVEPLELRR